MEELRGAEAEREFLRELARVFRQAPREVAEKDVPEGARYVTMSDTLAVMIAERLEEMGGRDG